MINKLFNNKGFSLIELSIVLIILGLLVAGVTGGASMIQSAKINSVIIDYNTYKTAYNSYYERYGKVPNEDPDNLGLVKDFTGFKDLYDKGFIDIEPVYEETRNIYYIQSKLGSVVWDLRGGIGNSFGQDWNKQNMLVLGGYFSENIKHLNSKEAKSIENKIDDGSADTGLVRSYDYSIPAMSFGTDDGTRNIGLGFKMDF